MADVAVNPRSKQGAYVVDTDTDDVDVSVARARRLSPVSRQISWGAILGGVVVTLVAQLALNMLGLSIGANTINPLYEVTPAEPGMGTAATVWMIGSALLAAFAGGWVASRLSGTVDDVHGVLHGVITWGLVALILLFVLTSTAGGLISGMGRVVSQGITLVTEGAVEAAPEVADLLNLQETTLATIGNEARGLITANTNANAANAATGDQPEAAQSASAASGASNGTQFASIDELEFNNRLNRYLSAAEPDETQRQELISFMSQTMGITEQEATARLDRWQQVYADARVQAESTAREVGQALTDTLAAVSGVVFAVLLAGAFAAGVGGYAAAEQREEVVRTRTVRR